MERQDICSSCHLRMHPQIHLHPASAISITGEARQIDVRAPPILSFPLCCANTIGSAIRTPPVGKVQQIKKICENSLLVL
jgi:hypothetical protein